MNNHLLDDMIQDINRAIELTKRYINMKVQSEDWSGVIDAASDLLQLNASLKSIKQLL